MSPDPALLGQTAGGDLCDTLDIIEDTASEIDEISSQLTELNAQNETRHAQILEQLNSCLQKVETLYSTQTAENPLLTQVLNQVTELKAEILKLKESMDLMPRTPPQSESVVIEQVPTLELSTPNPGESTEEPLEGVENPPETKRRNHRFV